MGNKEIKRSIDYIRIAEDLNDEAINFCIDHIYRFMNYQVLKKEDIRRIDLEEWLLNFFNQVPEYRKGRARGSLNFYMFLLQLYLTDSLKIYPESNAEKYKKRALELIETILYNDYVLEDIDDVVLIFTGLFRFHEKKLKNVKLRYLKESIKFTFFEQDADFLEEIRKNNCDCEPDGILPYKNIIYTLGGSYSEDAQKARNFMYINNILFLSRGLQKQGCFS